MNHIVYASVFIIDTEEDNLGIKKESSLEFEPITFQSDDVLYMHRTIFKETEMCTVVFRCGDSIMVGETNIVMHKRVYGIPFPKTEPKEKS